MPGQLAFVSQSGALATALLDWANARSIGFSHFVSLGDGADVDVADLLDYLGSDPRHARDPAVPRVGGPCAHASCRPHAPRHATSRCWWSRPAARTDGAKAAASHTGALAATDEVFDAAVRRAGMLRVDTLDELFDAAETLARARPPHGERLAILTNGGGAGVLAADALAMRGGRLAELGAETMAAPRSRPAGELVARQSGRHHRRRARAALRGGTRGAAGRPRGRRGAVHARADAR